MRSQARITALFFCMVMLLCVSGAAASSFYISEFCPDTWLDGEGDEYFIIGGMGDLSGIFVTDGEGSVKFPSGTSSDGSICVARNSADFNAVHGSSPDFEIYDSDPDIPDMIRSGSFRMANEGDSLTMMKGSSVIDEVEWPGDVVTGEGRVHVCSGGVWDDRIYYIGQSRFSAETFSGVPVTVFTAPESSYAALEEFIGGSEKSLLVNVYEFTGSHIADLLTDASKRGVEVDVLLEGSPVGGISDEEYEVCGVLESAGIPVSLMETENGVFHAPYRYDHAKYVVSDGTEVLIASENFGDTGFPPEATGGNRGWGVIAESPGLASYFTSVFGHDTGGGWTAGATGVSGVKSASGTSAVTGMYPPQSFENATVTPVISPDTSYLVGDMISGAVSSLDIEQAYIKNWSCGENPWLEEAIDAARRGVCVRILLDSYWYNTEGDDDNDEMAAYINSVAESLGLSLEARLMDISGGDIEKVHNKGVIVDEKTVLVSSINWNENSPSYNREAGLIIEQPEAAAYFTGVFDSDWERSASPQISGSASSGESDDLKKLIAVAVIGLIAVLYLVRKFH